MARGLPDIRVIPHWIGGKESDEAPGRTGDVYDPATGRTTAKVAFATPAQVDEAVSAASAAFKEWRNVSLSRKSKILFAFREILASRTTELAAIVTSEHGKVLADAKGEVERALEAVEFACGIPHLMKGQFSEEISTRVDSYSIRQPLGVVGIITPFNFPTMVPAWFFPIAIAAGNTVVLKPSEKDPSPANWMAEVWAEAGLPPGVFNVVHGDKVAVDRLLDHPDVRGTLFRGLYPDCPLRLRAGYRTRKAGAGTWWCEEPHGGLA